MSCKRQCNVREMLHFVVLLNLILGVSRFVDGSAEGDSEFGEDLISSLRNDANLDLSVDEEYEDLRAELLAYHTALASLTDKQNRRSMMTTPCWQLGGVCINVKLCEGYRFLTEVPGCKNRLYVCCFAWNQFRVKDYKPQGISELRLPWSIQYKFGGKGVVHVDDESEEQKEHKHLKSKDKGKQKKQKKQKKYKKPAGKEKEVERESGNESDAPSKTTGKVKQKKQKKQKKSKIQEKVKEEKVEHESGSESDASSKGTGKHTIVILKSK